MLIALTIPLGVATYYTELHPLSAATTAMLNINGTTTSEDSQNSNGSVQGLHPLYDYYKLPVVVDGSNKGITLLTADGKSVTDGQLQEIWR